MSLVPIEVGGRRIVYPRTYDRKYYGWFELTRSRLIGLIWLLTFTLLGLVFHIGFAILCLAASFYLVVPTIDGHGFDTVVTGLRSYALSRKGGYPASGSLLDPTQERSNPLQLVVYELPTGLDLAVVRNQMTRRDMVVIEITGWKDISTCDPLERISRENSFNEVIQELTAQEYFSRFSCFSMRRTADGTDIWEELEHSSGDHPLREHIDAAVAEIYLGSEELGPAATLRYFMVMQTRVNSSAQKIINSGTNLRRIPAVDSLMMLRDALEMIDMTVDIPSEEELAAIMRQLHDPLDEHTAALLATDAILDREGDDIDDVPLSLQRPAIPPYRVGENWIAFNEHSYHTILMQKRVKVHEPPPGWLDTFYAGGLSDLCVSGLTVDVIPKSGTQASASLLRRYARGREHDKAMRGSMPTARESEEHEAALRAFDELDLSEGELATYCLYVIVSAGSPEELYGDVSAILKTCRGFGLYLNRVTGPGRQLPAFHSAVGLM